MMNDIKSDSHSPVHSVPSHHRQRSRSHTTKTEPASIHTSDPFLKSFLASSFDPAAYLNATLPPLLTSSTPSSAHAPSYPSGSSPAPVSLEILNSEAQELLSQLGAHTTRLSDTLTVLTDEILRSGSRLAYEVELLRGEALGLEETLNEGLRDEVQMFVPGGLGGGENGDVPGVIAIAAAAEEGGGDQATNTTKVAHPTDNLSDPAILPPADGIESLPNDPPSLTQLRTLSLVRTRLESVIKTFGDAMDFPLPPSMVSLSSSFLSVSAPDPSSSSTIATSASSSAATGKNAPLTTEERGQQVLQALRDEITGLLYASYSTEAAGKEEVATDGGAASAVGTNQTKEEKATSDAVRGIEEATKRVEKLKELSKVWKGTAEEKGRARFVDELAKMVEDRHREVLKELRVQQQHASPAGGRKSLEGTGPAPAAAAAMEAKGPLGGYGFMSQLQKIRSGL